MRILPPALCLVLACGGAFGASGDDAPFQERIVCHSWRDRPAEFLTEINLRLPPHLRFAWYVDPVTNGAVYPGPVIDVPDGRRVAEVIDTYCAETGLAWSRRDRSVWIHRRPAGDEATDLAARMTTADAEVRHSAMAEIISGQDPVRMGLLLAALASKDGTVRQEARRYAAKALGASDKAFYNRHQMVLDLYTGLQPHLWQPRSVIGQYGTDRSGPWVWAHVTLGMHPDALAALRKAIGRLDTAGLAKDIPLLVLGTAGLLDEVRPALKAWSEKTHQEKDPATGKVRTVGRSLASRAGFRGWEDRWATSRGDDLLAWMDARRNGAWPAAIDYTARAQEIRATMVEWQAVEALRQEATQLQESLPALKEAAQRVRQEQPKDRRAHKAADQAIKQAQGRINAIANELRQADNANKKAIDQLGGGFRSPGLFTPAAVHLVEIAAAPKNDLVMRRWALMKLPGFRGVAETIPVLAKILAEDKQPMVRDLAGQGLGTMRTPAGIAVLVEAVADPTDRYLRQGGAIGLALARHPGAGSHILKAVAACTGDERTEERHYLLQVLGLCRDPAAGERLVAIARTDGDTNDRIAATLGLSMVPTTEAQAVLVELINDEGESVTLREAAVSGLTPDDGDEARRMLPILLDALPNQRNSDLGVKMVDAVWVGTKYLSDGTPLKARVGEVCLEVFVAAKVPTMVRTRLLNVFKNTDNTPATLEGLRQAMEAEKNPVLKQFIKNAMGNVEAGLKAARAPAGDE